MADASDIELLRNYTQQGAENAFAELVRRHIHLVYSAAMRHAGVAVHAEEITQAVFVILAQKAGRLREGVILEAWLYQTTRLTALSFLRGERRRQLREQEAYMQSQLQETGNSPVWNELAPLLDEAMSRLGEKDREAILLRFFKEKKLEEVAAAMNITGAAAQSRVHRALEKLRMYLSKRGVNSTAETIARTISANSIQAAPAMLVKSVIAVALAKGATTSISTSTLIKGALKLMAWTKAKTAVVVAVGILFVAGTATITVKEIKAHGPQIWQAGFDMSVLDRVPSQATILPALPSRDPNINSWRGRPSDGKIMGLNDSPTEILSAAYGVPGARMIFSTPLPEGKYDFISNVSTNQRQALQQAIKNTFGLVGSYQSVSTNVLELVVRKPAVGLKKSASAGPEFSGADGFIWLSNQPVATLAYFNEYFMGTPVENHTRLKGYYDLKWDSTTNGLQQAELENLGLELVPTNMPVKMLVVEKTK